MNKFWMTETLNLMHEWRRNEENPTQCVEIECIINRPIIAKSKEK